MSDFEPSIRNAAIWSGDSRRIASGNATGVVLEKLGRTVPDDLSGEEHVQMGHVIEPVVARIFEDRHGVSLKPYGDTALTHPTQAWLRSHFDYEGPGYLVECKNYDANYARQFSEADEPVRIPNADYAQCLHEALVHGTDTVWLAVLFGGQRYREYKLEFTADDKEKWLKRLAEVWGNIQTSTIPPAATPDQARDIWPQDDSHTIVASKQAEFLCEKLSRLSAQHKENEKALDAMKTELMNYIGSRSILVSVDGRTLATWKTSKGSKRFSAELLKSSMPDLYEKFTVDASGSRRFLVKG